MSLTTDRRDFLKTATAAAVSTGIAAAAMPFEALAQTPQSDEPMYKISLAEWSLNKALFGGEMSNLEFPAFAKNEFGIEAVEYVNQFFKDKATDTDYMHELKTRADDAGVRSLLIMIDGEGDLGNPNDEDRTQAVENHYKWVEAAKPLGCHSIRVNARSQGTYDEQRDLAADGLRRLSEFAADHGINVIVENHGGLSSNAQWLVAVIEQVGLPNCGTLPDFGNFWISRGGGGQEGEQYDKYQGVQELMPFAKGVSAKTHAFDSEGNETSIDYYKMMNIVVSSGYHGYVGIEWEGRDPGEVEGIRLTKQLLERVRQELA